MCIATFAGVFASNERYTYCGNKNLLNEIMSGSTHTGVLWLSAFLSFQDIIINIKIYNYAKSINRQKNSRTS